MTARRVLLAGTLFYVIICPFFFHPDLKIIYSLAALLTHGVVNIYAAFSADPSSFSLGPFVYPPLAYFLMGGFFAIAKLLAGGGFTNWLLMGNTAVQVEGIYRYLFAIKLPFILVHLLSGWLLSQWVATPKKTLVAAIWFFNPVSIYIVALLGQIDGLAVLAIILALFFAKRRPTLGAISLGLGGAIKAFPLLLLPVYIILVAKTWKQRLILGAAGLVAYGLCIVGFLNTPGFYQQALTSGLAKNILTAGIPIILTIIVGIAFVFHRGKIEKLNNYFLLIALVALVGIQFHPQWALWALPMATIYIANSKKWWWGVMFVGGFVGNLLSFSDKFLTFGLLSPIDPAVFYLPSPPDLIGNHATLVVWMFGKILLLGCLIWIAYETVVK